MNFFTDSLSYPFRGSGKFILLIGAIISLIADLASLAPFIGGLASLILSGYFCAVYFKIIESSAVGDQEAPEYPDISNIMEDVIWPMIQIFVVLALSFSPLLAYLIYAAKTPHPWIVTVLTGVGYLYAPMAILAIVVLGYMGALSPQIVIPSILRAGWLYFAAVIMIFAVYWLEAKLSHLLDGLFLIKFPIIATVSIYSLMVNGRALGLIFRDRREELNWI